MSSSDWEKHRETKTGFNINVVYRLFDAQWALHIKCSCGCVLLKDRVKTSVDFKEADNNKSQVISNSIMFNFKNDRNSCVFKQVPEMKTFKHQWALATR